MAGHFLNPENVAPHHLDGGQFDMAAVKRDVWEELPRAAIFHFIFMPIEGGLEIMRIMQTSRCTKVEFRSATRP
jgi:hypothetical protein